jgi:hypothetical protein
MKRVGRSGRIVDHSAAEDLGDEVGRPLARFA